MTRRVAWALIATIAVTAVVAAARPAGAGIYGYDGWFHIKYAEWIRHHGLGHDFPWWQETFLRDRFADKELLYHVLLMPFTFGDLEAGGRAASYVFATALFLSIAASLRWLGTRAPIAWTLACAVSSTTLIYRAGLLRAVVPGVAIAVIGVAAIVRGSRAGAAIASAAYALTHIAWQLLPGIALAHDLVGSLLARRIRMQATLWSIAGTAAGVILNPYFPANLKIWYVQNVSVLTFLWSPGRPDLGGGGEFRPPGLAALLRDDPGPILFTAAGLMLLLAPRSAHDARAGDPGRCTAAGVVSLGVVSTGFLALSLLSRRFVEVWAPMAVLFAATAAARRGPPARRLARPAVAAGALAFVLIGGMVLARTRGLIADDPGRVFDACTTWIRDNVAAGETVFTSDWDEFPELFYTAPQQRYLVGLDPAFMYVTDPQRWQAWRDVVEGRAPDIAGAVERTFGSRVIFADAGEEIFVERAGQDPRLSTRVADADCTVFTLRDLPGDGPWAAAVAVTWRGEAGPPVTAGPGDFVDVAALSGAAPARGDCAVVTGRFTADRATAMRFAVSSDDIVAITIDGALVHDDRAVPPPTLEEALARRRPGGPPRFERIVEADVTAGYNDVLVSTCRTGRAWGFHFGAVASR